MTCGPLHIQPEHRKKVRGEDGRERAYCPQCRAFKGYVVLSKEPVKKPEKGK